MIISALLVGLIVVGTFSGLNSTNRATSIDRARSQADALAEQNQEQMRSYPIKTLDELTSVPKTKTVTEGKAVFTIEESVAFKKEEEESTSANCSLSSPNTEYLKTTSKVTSPSISGKAVEETGIISPPAGSALVVQVQESGNALSGAKVVATGPSPATTPYELETSSKGCAILTVPPGEYNIYVSKTGYVTPNWYENTHEDLSTTRTVYLPAETTAKEGYNIGKAGKLAVSFITGSTASEGNSFVAFNPLMSSYRKVTTTPIGTYKSTVESPSSVFPFESQYTVYAGTCEADSPSPAVIKEHESNFLTIVKPGVLREMTTIQPPINIIVKSGKSITEPGKVIENATVKLTDTGCSTSREMKTNSEGALSAPGAPFGKYSLCVTGGVSGGKNGTTTGLAANKKYTSLSFANDTATGPSELKNITNGGLSPGGSAIIYMESGATGPGELVTGNLC